jgi:hypothetical protein
VREAVRRHSEQLQSVTQTARLGSSIRTLPQ